MTLLYHVGQTTCKALVSASFAGHVLSEPQYDSEQPMALRSTWNGWRCAYVARDLMTLVRIYAFVFWHHHEHPHQSQ